MSSLILFPRSRSYTFTASVVGGIDRRLRRYLKRNSLASAHLECTYRTHPNTSTVLSSSTIGNSVNFQPSSLKFPSLVLLSQSVHTMGDSETRRQEIEARKAELKKRLTPLQYHVTQEKGTERAYTGKYYKTTEAGIYSCVVCEEPLFSSETKFDSGCGWPAFNEVLAEGKVKLLKDTSNDLGSQENPKRQMQMAEGMIRTEVQCARCDAHLGHVFNDGPPPKRKRFCINSASIDFQPFEEEKKGQS